MIYIIFVWYDMFIDNIYFYTQNNEYIFKSKIKYLNWFIKKIFFYNANMV